MYLLLLQAKSWVISPASIRSLLLWQLHYMLHFSVYRALKITDNESDYASKLRMCCQNKIANISYRSRFLAQWDFYATCEIKLEAAK